MILCEEGKLIAESHPQVIKYQQFGLVMLLETRYSSVLYDLGKKQSTTFLHNLPALLADLLNF